MKKIINNVDNVVKEMLLGIKKTNPNVKVLLEHNVVIETNIDTNKVALISGGGSGHEPAHAGFVGKGMLTGAVCGEVFTSPTPDMVQGAIENINSKKGTLLVIKNYSGDVMNFEIAAELAQAQGLNVDYVVVNDDVAVENSTWTTGRRGIAGTIFVHKIAGAAAHAGLDLPKVKAVAQKVIDNTRTMGLSLGHCIVPANGKPSFELLEDEMEVGLGIHGEPGVQKQKVVPSKELVKILLDKVLADLDYTKSPVALMVNGLGATTQMELLIAASDAIDYLTNKKIKVHSSKVGNYMTSLEMPGLSITLVALDKELTKYLDAETEVRNW